MQRSYGVHDARRQHGVSGHQLDDSVTMAVFGNPMIAWQSGITAITD
jgi:hypothetical protein